MIGSQHTSEIESPYVFFRAAGQRCALALRQVERVIPAVEVTPLPSAPALVLGVISIQGSVVPVFDLGRRFGPTSGEMDISDELIIARTRCGRVALRVEEVFDVASHPGGAEAEAAAVLGQLQGIAGVLPLAEGLVLIYDLDRCLSAEETAGLEKALRAVGA